MPKIAILIGSDSDIIRIKDCLLFLKENNIEFELNILSAHRLPQELYRFASGARKNGFEIIIAAAGMSAHLPGVCASYTDIPVIALPLKAKGSDGYDALLSIINMPPGIPVAAVGIDAAKNAAILACQILAVKYPDIRKKLENIKIRNRKNLISRNNKLKKIGWEKYLEINEK